MIITINQLERNTADDSVVTAHWNALLTDGDYSASSYGSASFTKVVDGMAEVEANLQAQIDEQKAPTMVTGTPWSEAVLEEVA